MEPSKWRLSTQFIIANCLPRLNWMAIVPFFSPVKTFQTLSYFKWPQIQYCKLYFVYLQKFVINHHFKLIVKEKCCHVTVYWEALFRIGAETKSFLPISRCYWNVAGIYCIHADRRYRIPRLSTVLLAKTAHFASRASFQWAISDIVHETSYRPLHVVFEETSTEANRERRKHNGNVIWIYGDSYYVVSVQQRHATDSDVTEGRHRTSGSEQWKYQRQRCATERHNLHQVWLYHTHTHSLIYH
jgi:hypothetical protein